MRTNVALDLKHITSAVAARHGMLVSPDDPAMLLVTMNELVLEQVIGNIEGHIEDMVAGIEAGLRSAQREALKKKREKLGTQCVRRFRRILIPGDYTRES
jgi:hypothetical protein